MQRQHYIGFLRTSWAHDHLDTCYTERPLSILRGGWLLKIDILVYITMISRRFSVRGRSVPVPYSEEPLL